MPAMCCHGCMASARDNCPYIILSVYYIIHILATPSIQLTSLTLKFDSVLLYCSESDSRKIIVNLSTVVLAPPLPSTYTLLVIFFMEFPLILSALPVIQQLIYFEFLTLQFHR